MTTEDVEKAAVKLDSKGLNLNSADVHFAANEVAVKDFWLGNTGIPGLKMMVPAI